MLQLDWNATIDSIRETLPQTQFQNWFKPLQLVRVDERSVVVGVPSRFHEDWLRSHYADKLNTAIRKQTGTDLQLEFEIIVRDENAEAARSAPPVPAPGSRPNLRIVERNPDMAPPEKKVEVEEERRIEVPVFPTVTHPFIELDFNRVPHQCVHMFTTGGLPLNPLIIQGGIGMGKTHLLADIGRRSHAANPRLRIRYTNFENFSAEMVRHLKEDSILTFKRKYRDETDLLLFDDVQGLTRRMKTQEELLHIFNEITSRGGRVAFTTSVAPHRLEEFIEPLKSRLNSGVLAEIKTPSFQERVDLLAATCKQSQIVVDAMVLRSLADKGQKDVRELMGSLFRLHLQSQLENKPLDTDYLAKENWSRERDTQKETVTMSEIVTLVEHNYGICRTELASKSRKGATTWARQVAMYLARHYTLLPLEEIGKTFGRDHATVIHAFQKVTETMESQPTRRYEVEFLKQKLQSRGPEKNGTPF